MINSKKYARFAYYYFYFFLSMFCSQMGCERKVLPVTYRICGPLYRDF